MNLVIVESPTKAKTISRFLNDDYTVTSSYGHVRDLPKSSLGVDPENNFEPHYIIPRKQQTKVTALRKTALKADRLILATDEDREGEAIAWHLAQVLNGENNKSKSRRPPGSGLRPAPEGSSEIEVQMPEETKTLARPLLKKKVSGDKKLPIERIVFHEITARAIQEALTKPRAIDLRLVDAQQARRVLDRLVGYKLSPFLWKKIQRGLSAGRVQSVALRLIVEREETIQRFKPEVYYSLTATVQSPEDKTAAVTLLLEKIGETEVPKPGIKTKAEAEELVNQLQQSNFMVRAVDRRDIRKHPLPPFITSTLQQTAAQHFGFSSRKTMWLAQTLYEEGRITYMRTDSVNLSNEALLEAGDWIKNHLAGDYHLAEPRRFKSTSRLAQEAHEAIRPTSAEAEPTTLNLEKDLAKLYDLIWRRFIASQLPPAVLAATKITVAAKPPTGGQATLGLGASGNVIRFDGFLKIWPSSITEKILPVWPIGQTLLLQEARADEHFTEPPPRFNEASLIKILEKYGIGRPSTYAPIISVIQERNYVVKDRGRFTPTEIGTLVNKILTENFPQVVDVDFTANLEADLDEIAAGAKEWRGVIGAFYKPFAKQLAEKYELVSKKELINETTDQVCDKCGRPMIIKFGRFGKFMACSGFPDCKNTKALAKEAPKSTGLNCPKCRQGELVERRVSRGRARGKIFWGCSRYPDCDYASWKDPTKTDEDNATKELKKNEN